MDIDRITSKYCRTGATGYIGGDALYALHHKHPEFSFTILVRDISKNDQIKASFPDARIVNGALDDYELLKKEAADADIVVRKCILSSFSPSPNLY
jgi:N-acetyl-gamma-glutamylphosphate reductase